MARKAGGRKPQRGLMQVQVVAAGAVKAGTPAWRVMAMALMAAAYISFGALLLLSVGGTCTGLAAVRSMP